VEVVGYGGGGWWVVVEVEVMGQAKIPYEEKKRSMILHRRNFGDT